MAKQSKADRALYIRKKIQSGVGALQADPRYDWDRESEDIYTAAESLTQAELDFAAGKIDEDAVRVKYKTYVELHLVGAASESNQP